MTRFRTIPDSRVIEIVARKVPKVEYCPRWTTPSTTDYDKRTIRLNYFGNSLHPIFTEIANKPKAASW